MIKRINELIGKYKWYAILAPISTIGEVALEIGIPYLMAKIIDDGIVNKDIPYIAKIGLLMILMAFMALVFGTIAGRLSAVASTGFSKNIRKTLFDKIQDFSFANVDKFGTASLVTRLTTDVTNVQNAFMMILRICVRAPIMFVCALAMTIKINGELAVIFLISAPVLGIGLYFIATRAFVPFRKMLKKYDKLNSIVQENLIGIRPVKAFVRGNYEYDKFEKSAGEVRDAQKQAEGIIIFGMPLMQVCVYMTIVAILFFGGRMIMQGTMKVGELTSFIAYVKQIMMSLMMIAMVFVNLILSRASISRIDEVLDEEPNIVNPEEAKTVVSDGSIDFKNVSFGYEDDKNNAILNNINLHIKSGETIGIIGGTGSSKTSLVQLIPRLYDVFDGEVLVGGKNVKEYDIKALRDSVSMVLQNNVLFSGTIADNLRWGDENASDDEIRNACKCACIDDFITSLPEGYNTNLGQGGVNLSGGQKQRLCIARALLKKPKIIIMDDSTSAVDTATDRSIRNELNKNLAGTTTIIIAQRISSILESDKIIIMDDGNISDIGTHDDLLKNNEIYQEIYYSQQKGDEEIA